MTELKKVETNDGSITFHHDKFDECLHSMSGAAEEARKKYVNPCKIKDLAKENDQLMILDVCFGLGYNTAAAIDAALKVNPKIKINVIALENDDCVLEAVANMGKTDSDWPPFECYHMINKMAKEHAYSDENITISLYHGDARTTIKKLCINGMCSFDAVFFDPFSPKKCPELWTQEFFEEIYKVMKVGSILATYSCARVVRNNLEAAGFKVKDGPIVGRKAPGTIAIKK